jgi:hypothetical protein
VLAAPISLRERVLSEAPSIVAAETGRAWSSDGFPKAPGQGRGPWRYFAGALVALALVVGLSGAVGEGVIPMDASTTPDGPVPSTSVPTTGPSTTVAGPTPPTTAPVGSGGADGGTSGGTTTTGAGGGNTTTTVVGEEPPVQTPPRGDPGDAGDTTPPTDGTPTPPVDDPSDHRNPPTFSLPTVTFYIPTPTVYTPPAIVTTSSIPTLR